MLRSCFKNNIIFSLLFFACYMYILALHIDKRWSLYALFVVQVLWVNFHGFFFFGPFIVLVGIGAEFLKRHVQLPWEWNVSGRLTDGEYARLKRIFIAVILASLFNPLTFRGAWYPIGILLQLSGESRIFFQYIQELRPPIELHTIFSTSHFMHYKLLILISFLTFVFNRRRIDIGDFFIWAVFLGVSLSAVRNIVFFAFAAYLVCMTNTATRTFTDILPVRFSDTRFVHITGMMLKIALMMWMLNYGTAISQRGYFDFDRYEMKSEFGGITQRSYPHKAADFLVEHDIAGNFFNDFNSGAYLIGRCYPNIRVFIDGRTEVYGPKLFEEYRKIWVDGNKNLFSEAVDKYALTGALLHSVQAPIPEKTLKLFSGSEEWVLVYLDYDGVIFLKDIPENHQHIEKLKIDLDTWEPPSTDLFRLGSRRVVPYQHVHRAQTLEAMGFDDLALQEAKEALDISPGFAEPYRLMGKIYGRRNEHMKAFKNFRIATMINPHDPDLRLNLGLAYEQLGDFTNALKQYEVFMKGRQDDFRGYFARARVLITDGQYDVAMDSIRHAHSHAPQSVKELLDLGDLFCELKQFEFAKDVFDMAVSTGIQLPDVYNRLGLCCYALGRDEEAREAFGSGLAIEPEHEELRKNIRKLNP